MANVPRGAWYWLVLLALAGLLGAYVHYRDLHGRYLRYQQSEDDVRWLQDEREALEEKERSLRRRVERLDTDPVEMEAESRRSKNLVREGETIYQIEVAPDRVR